MERWFYAWGAGYAAVGASSVLLPLYAITLGGGALIIGLIAAAAVFTALPSALLWGYLSRRIDRPRLFLLGSLGAFAGVLAATPRAEEPETLILVNAALWFIIAAAAPVILLLIVEGVPQTEWDAQIGLLNKVQGYGWVSGITAGTVWTVALMDRFSIALNQEMLFRALAGMMLFAALTLLACYPKKPTTSAEEFVGIFRNLNQTDWGAGRFIRAVPYGPTRLYWTITAYAAIRREGQNPIGSFDSSLRRYLFATTLFFAGFAVFWAPLPAYILDITHGAEVVFGLILLTNFGAIVGYGPMGGFFERDDLRLFQTIGLIIRAILIPSVALVVLMLPMWNLPTLAWVFFIIGITWAVIGVTVPGIITNLSSEQYEPEALGIYTMLAGFATGIGAIAGGWIAQSVSFTVTFVIAGGTILVGTLIIPRE